MSDFIKKLNAVQKALKKMPQMVSKEAVRFSKERFQQANWIDNSTENWKKRKTQAGSATRNRRNILTDTGRLRRSIRTVKADQNNVVIGTDVPYAAIHNNGGRYTVNQSVREHTRRAHRRGSSTVKEHQVDSHNRTMRINMPRRQFMGKSQYLTKRLIRMMGAEVNRQLK
jgi:phage gpG-like protein